MAVGKIETAADEQSMKRPQWKKRGVPEGLWQLCPGCQSMIYRKEAEESGRPLGEGIGLSVRGELVLVATPAEAATRGISPAALAERWARGLRTVLGPGTAVAKGRLRVSLRVEKPPPMPP